MEVFQNDSKKRSLVADHSSYLCLPINKAYPVHPCILGILIQTKNEEYMLNTRKDWARKVKTKIVFMLLTIGCVFFVQEGVANEFFADSYSIRWDTPSKDSSGSMPLGNGGIGINLWVEEKGDLFFYIGKTDAWSENARLLKLGRIRVQLTPNPFENSTAFQQTLDLKSGSIHILAGKSGEKADLRVWVDANNPVIQVEIKGERPYEVSVSLENWRKQPRELKDKDEMHSAYGLAQAPFPVIVTPDKVVDRSGNDVVWYHRNERSIWPLTLKHQGLEPLVSKLKDPLLHRTFGGLISGNNFVKKNSATICSSKLSKNHRVSMYVLTEQTDTADEWLKRLDENVKKIQSENLKEAFERHREWWKEFWDRSYIHVKSDKDKQAAEIVTQGYALQRFISACAGRGGSPIKFNGSIFNVDTRINPEKTFDADYRRWGGPYWFQNTRLVYWPMLMAGDFRLMHPLFDMYLEALPFAQERTRLYFDHAGAFYPETMYFWGAYAIDNYGWEREGKPISLVDNRYIRYYFDGALELLTLVLDAYRFTQNDLYLNQYLIPLAEPVLRFYDDHYSRDADGLLRIEPSQALETWQKATNPLPVVAGLQFVCDRLIAFGEKIPNSLHTLCKKIRSDLPALPKATDEEGNPYQLPAEEFDELGNSENPELYAIFPYRLYGVGKPNLEIARNTFEKRRVKRTGGWTQDPVQAAYLGLTEIAKDYTVQNFSTHHEGSRFPAFWGPNFDWIPDQDHGNVSMIALQSMLMQYDGDRILLFPAWPEEWDVEFKLRAPGETVVECVYRDGEVKSLMVTPESRREDLSL